MNIVSLPHPNKFLVVEPLDYPNPYDFKVPHRHDYFELIFIKKGAGEQLIDFTKSKLEANRIYMIYPGQIHLLKRGNAEGMIIQFRKAIFEFLFPLQHHFLYFSQAEIQLSNEEFEHLYQISESILKLNNTTQLSSLSVYKSYSYLQIILISIIESQKNESLQQTNKPVGIFLHLVHQNIRGKRKVSDYAEMMNITPEKLSALCKEALATNPLKIIHEELLLEIKRLMILGELSLKEIAYELNFDSTANFSSFVKSATDHTPSELQKHLKHQLI